MVFLVVIVVVDTDDLAVIRFLAMDIITNSAYHAFPQEKSPFFAVGLLTGAPTWG